MNAELERCCVVCLLQAIGRDGFEVTSVLPPKPDVRVTWPDGRSEFFEITDIHPDERPSKGSAMREEEERRARSNPNELKMSWVPTNVMPAILHRIHVKINKAARYELGEDEPVSLLLVASLAKIGADASTFVVSQFINTKLLNGESHELLTKSLFACVYLHAQIDNSVWKWSRPQGWRVLMLPSGSTEGMDTLKMVKAHASGATLLHGTRVIGSWNP